MKTYYYLVEGREHGPASLEKVRQKIREGRITPGTRVWTAGLSDWHRAEEVLNLFPATVSMFWQVSAAVLGAVLVGVLALGLLALAGGLGGGGGGSTDDRWQQALNDTADG